MEHTKLNGGIQFVWWYGLFCQVNSCILYVNCTLQSGFLGLGLGKHFHIQGFKCFQQAFHSIKKKIYGDYVNAFSLLVTKRDIFHLQQENFVVSQQQLVSLDIRLFL